MVEKLIIPPSQPSNDVEGLQPTTDEGATSPTRPASYAEATKGAGKPTLASAKSPAAPASKTKTSNQQNKKRPKIPKLAKLATQTNPLAPLNQKGYNRALEVLLPKKK